jgi:hypothetical protein
MSIFLTTHRIIPRITKFYRMIGYTVGSLTLAINSFNALPYIYKEINDDFHTKDSLLNMSMNIMMPIIGNFSICVMKSCIYGVWWPITAAIFIKRAHLAYQSNDKKWLSPLLIPGADSEKRIDRKYLNWPFSP